MGIFIQNMEGDGDEVRKQGREIVADAFDQRLTNGMPGRDK